MESGYLEQYHDAELELPEIPGRETLEAAEVERISRALAVVLYTSTIPRRLGGDATDQDLIMDKKHARRAAHALRQSLLGWTKKVVMPTIDDEIRREGAQLMWVPFRDAHLAEVQIRLRVVATWAVRSGDARWGKSAVTNLSNELRWVEYALRD
jgi:hypothetical protein